MNINFYTHYGSHGYLKTTNQNINTIPDGKQQSQNINSSKDIPQKVENDQVNITSSDKATSEQLQVIESILEEITDKDVEILDVKEFNSLFKEKRIFKENLAYKTNLYNGKEKFSYKSFYKEVESLKLSTELTVLTESGEKLNIELDLSFSQEFVHKTNFRQKNASDFSKIFQNFSSKDKLRSKLNLQIEIEPVAIIPQHTKEEDITNIETIQQQDTQKQDTEKLVQDSTINNENISAGEELNTTQVDNTSQKNNQENNNDEIKDYNSSSSDFHIKTQYMDFLKIWSKHDNGQNILIAIGFLTHEKIYLTSTKNAQINPTQDQSKLENNI